MKCLFCLILVIAGLNTFAQSIDQRKKIDSFLRIIPKGSKVEIKVTSANQKGGQTAFIINNYYGDTAKKLLPKENIAWHTDSFQGCKGISVWPVEGKWDHPFIVYPKCWLSKKETIEIIGGNFTENSQSVEGSGSIVFQGRRYDCIHHGYFKPCNEDDKLFIPIENGTFGFFMFGDEYNTANQYTYDFGEIRYSPNFTKGSKKTN